MKPYELTPEEVTLLTKQQQAKYHRAIRYCNEETARGPFGGWADGHDMLKELGWTEEGHRRYVTLVKPTIGVWSGVRNDLAEIKKLMEA